MAYSGNSFFRSIVGVLAVVGFIVAAGAGAAYALVIDLDPVRALTFKPETAISMAIDRIKRDLTSIVDGAGSSFRSFFSTALQHDLFIAGHYDPGWRAGAAVA